MSIVEFIRYILFGIVQGVFEVLPVSSSGHVAFIQNLTSEEFNNSLFFLILVNLGSLLAIILYMRKTIKLLACDSYKYVIKKDHNPEYKKSVNYVKNIIIAIIPIGSLGIIFSVYNVLYDEYILIIIGIGALLTATILYLARKRTDMFTSTKMTYKKSIYIGLVQLLAVIPGVSRLAITTAAGTRSELSHETALKFSIMISIPISVGALVISLVIGLFDIKSLIDFDTTNAYIFIYYFTAMFVSFIGTFYALKFIFIITRKGNLRLFYIYNLLFGLTALFIGLYNY
ncbi:MAG: undecaprenyl-diphosphate phosphatase [Tenericutes bacterium]|jgi:undecaprenyl-diphosphatase|nr:undecaprenyl-diphosphate phosphatase [Mycoplasmatota bacterium]